MLGVAFFSDKNLDFTAGYSRFESAFGHFDRVLATQLSSKIQS